MAREIGGAARPGAPAEANRIHELVLPADYERRVIEAKRRVDELGLRYAWVAGQVDCSPGWVSQVLGRHRAGEPALEAIEALLARIEAGEVDVPEEAYRRRARSAAADRGAP